MYFMKKLYLLFLGLIIMMGLNAQVTVSPSSPLTVSRCSFPTLYSPLDDITLSETPVTGIADFATSGDFILSAPLNFEFKPATGTVSTTGGDLTISNVVISANSISFTITVNSILNSDVITISGIEVRGLTTPSGPSDIERIAATLPGIDAIVNGDDPGGTVNHGTLTSDLLAPTDITTDPTGAIYCQNGTATALSVTATGTGTLTYKWFSNTVNNNTSGTAVGGATSSSFTPPTVTAGTTYYYVEVTGTCGTIASNTAQVIVNASTDITTDPTGAIYCQNGTATAFSVTATGTGTSLTNGSAIL